MIHFGPISTCQKDSFAYHTGNKALIIMAVFQGDRFKCVLAGLAAILVKGGFSIDGEDFLCNDII